MNDNLKNKRQTDVVNDITDKDIEEIYDCEDSPLSYMIEPKITVDVVDKDDKVTPEDLEHILD